MTPSGRTIPLVLVGGENTVRVFLVEDHEVLQRCLRRALAPYESIQFVGSATSAAGAMLAVHGAAPDVVLLDLGLPDQAETSLLGKLRREVPQAKILVFSGHEDEYHVLTALRGGAHGYVAKTSPVAEIVSAIHRVMGGEIVLSSTVEHIAVAAMKPSAPPGELAALTRRELEVVRELVAGHSARMVASRLGISAKTVEVHRANAYKKLGCNSPQALMRLALRHGLVAV
jgi:DNA-binding NarL/FixJ family response regulator